MPKKIEQNQVRTVTLRRADVDPEARTVAAALSSETPVERWFGVETLVHSDEAINMERAAASLPLLFGHDHELPIGRIREIRLDGDRVLRGSLVFSKNAKAEEVWQDVRDGMLTDISVGYRIDDYVEEADDQISVTRWTPLEASVVAVPADHRVGINRSNSPKPEAIMPESKNPEQSGTTAPVEQTNVIDTAEFSASRQRQIETGRAEGQRLERERQQAIRRLFEAPRFQTPEYRDLMDACIERGLTQAQAAQTLLEFVGTGVEPVTDQAERQETGSAYGPGQAQARGTATAGKDQMEKFVEGATLSVLVRAQVERDAEKVRLARSGEFSGVKLSRLAEMYLRRSGVSHIPGNELDMVGLAITRQGLHGTSDFANLLENIANKAVLAGWGTAPETWDRWCRTGSLPDFRSASRTGLSEFSDLEIVYENGEYKAGSVSDVKEPIQLTTYGKMFHISRQAIINDDLDQLSRMPMKMGRAANRKVGDLAYAVLTDNATLNQDSTDLFHANHSNYIASGSGAAPSVTTIEAARTAMGTQTDPSGTATLNYEPAYLLVPKALQSTGNVLASAQYDPAGTAGTLTPNTVQGTFSVVADARLDTFLATGWYMAGDPMLTDTVEVAFLNGMTEPYMEQKDPWDKDGVSYKVRIDAGAAALDFRALYYNYGA
jgi:HK97 family phage prohead protease